MAVDPLLARKGSFPQIREAPEIEEGKDKLLSVIEKLTGLSLGLY